MAAPWPSTHWALPSYQSATAAPAPAHARAQSSTPSAAPGQGALAAATALRGPCPPAQPAALFHPPVGLPQQVAAAGQQQAAQQRRRRGCSRCITCVPHLRRHAHSLAALAARSRGSLPLRGSSEDGELWPGGLSSPSLYFAIRARQLQQQCRALNNAAAASLWRPAVEAPVQLLARRGAAQLRVKVPAAYTNVAPGDKCELVAIKDVVLCLPSPPAASTLPTSPFASTARATLPCLPGKAMQVPAFPASGSLPMPVTPEDAPLRPRAPSPPVAATAGPAMASTSISAAQLTAQLLMQAQQVQQQPSMALPAAANPSKRTSSSGHPAEAKRARLSDSFPALSPLLPALQLTPVMDSGASSATAPFMFSPRGTAALHCGSLAGSGGSAGSISTSSSAASLVGEPSANTVLPLVPLHPPAVCSTVPKAVPAAADHDQGHYLAVAQQRAASRAFTVVAIEPPPAAPAAASLASIFARWLRRAES